MGRRRYVRANDWNAWSTPAVSRHPPHLHVPRASARQARPSANHECCIAGGNGVAGARTVQLGKVSMGRALSSRLGLRNVAVPCICYRKQHCGVERNSLVRGGARGPSCRASRASKVTAVLAGVINRVGGETHDGQEIRLVSVAETILDWGRIGHVRRPR